MASDDEVANEKIYDKEYRRLRTLTSQTDIVEGSVSMWVCVCATRKHFAFKLRANFAEFSFTLNVNYSRNIKLMASSLIAFFRFLFSNRANTA